MLPVKKELLEGWLHKKKSGTKVFSALAGGANKRWFNVRELQSSWGPELPAELALCYYKSQREKEPDGWIYLKDVTKISDDEKVFTLASPARTMTLEAQTRAEHRLWLQGLVHLCTLADLSDVQSDIVKPAASSRPGNFEKAAGGGRAEEKPSSFAVLRSIQFKEEGDGESDSNLDDTPRSGSVSASSRSSSAKRDKPDRQDHRKNNFKPQSGANTASRMHGYIRKNADGSTPSAPPEEAAGPLDLRAEAKSEENVMASAKSLYSPEQDALHSAGPFNHRSSSKQTPESPDVGFGPGSNIDDMETVELSTVSRRLASSMLRQKRENMRRANDEENCKQDDEADHDERPTPTVAQGKIAPAKTVVVEEKPRQGVRRVIDQEDEDKKALELELEKLRSSLLATGVSSSTASGVESGRRAPMNAAEATTTDDDTEDEAEETKRDQASSSGATIRVPPRPPPGPGPVIRYAVKEEEEAHSKLPPPRDVANPDPNFVSENWDETSATIRVPPPRSSTAKPLHQTGGVTPDKNWLEEDFDKT